MKKQLVTNSHIYNLHSSVKQRKAEVKSQAQLQFHIETILLTDQVASPDCEH